MSWYEILIWVYCLICWVCYFRAQDGHPGRVSDSVIVVFFSPILAPIMFISARFD